jgi:hypothetical protein
MLAAFGENSRRWIGRDFVRGAGLSVAAAATRAHAQVRAVDLTIDSHKGLATMPQDFVGLSYESAQLADPAFFAASNTTLVRAFRELCPRGVLRLGAPERREFAARAKGDVVLVSSHYYAMLMRARNAEDRTK